MDWLAAFLPENPGEAAWVAVGFVGQLLFFSRFLVQWIQTEREKRVVVPIAFWYFSIGGGLVLFAYAAFHLKDPVFSLGQALGLLVYARNLYFELKERAAKRALTKT